MLIESLNTTYFKWYQQTFKFLCILKLEEYSGYLAKGSNLKIAYLRYQYQDLEFKSRVGGLVGFDNIEVGDFFCETFSLFIENVRLNSLSSNLLPSPVSFLVSLKLSCVHFESFDTTMLANCVNIRHLSLLVTFSKGVKFELDFLGALTKLRTLELTLSDTPSDLSVLKKLTGLIRLKLEGSSFFYAKKLPRLSKVVLEQIFSSKRLNELELSCFDIELTDREMLSECKQLDYLGLTRNRMRRVEDVDACSNNGFPICIENPERRVQDMHQTKLIELTHSGLRTLNAESFAGMKNLTDLSLTGNSISDLPRGVFQDLPSLHRLDLDKNLIRHISSGAFASFPRLWILQLDDNPIKSIDANAFAYLRTLTSLSLERCQLESIDSDMFNDLYSLKELNLCNNLIKRIEVITEEGRRINVAKTGLNNEEKELVKKHLFKHLSHLHWLDLSRNKLEKLDMNCFSNLRDLNKLKLSSNMIDELSGEIEPGLLSILEYLDLDDNQLTAIDKSALPKTLIQLGLSMNKLQRLDDDFFSECVKLKEVNVSHNELTWTITDATFASCRRSLDSINLLANRSIRVTEEAFEDVSLSHLKYDLSEHFINKPFFKILKIKKITPEVVGTLRQSHTGQSVRYNELEWDISNCSLQVLTRNRDCESEKEPPEIESSFNLSWLPHASQLRELDLSRNLIETLDDPELFVDFECMTKINISGNRLSRIHRDIFKSLLCLGTINLSGNRLTSIDMGLFRHLMSLRHLNLSSNNITFLNLTRLFGICPYLESLKIANNQLDDRSTAEIIDKRPSHFLVELSMANNRLEKMDFVRDMTHLEHLDLRGNRIESVMSNEGENLLGRLSKLIYIYLSGNKICPLTDEMLAHLHGKHLDISGNPVDTQLDSVLNEII